MNITTSQKFHLYYVSYLSLYALSAMIMFQIKHIFLLIILIFLNTHVSDGFTSSVSTTKVQIYGPSSSHLLASLDVQTDNSFEEYSRCLTPKQERDQINDELALANIPTWRRVVRKSLRGLGKVVRRLGGGDDVTPGTLILVRGGESEFSKNYTFTG